MKKDNGADPRKDQIIVFPVRCVRRAFLCDVDAESGKAYDHRNKWVVD